MKLEVGKLYKSTKNPIFLYKCIQEKPLVVATVYTKTGLLSSESHFYHPDDISIFKEHKQPQTKEVKVYMLKGISHPQDIIGFVGDYWGEMDSNGIYKKIGAKTITLTEGEGLDDQSKG